jgi:hypothetical protein
MKSFLITLGSVVLASSFAQAASSGPYTCEVAKVYDSDWNVISTSIQKTLNSLDCDTSKPVSTTPVGASSGVTNGAIVCCVKK